MADGSTLETRLREALELGTAGATAGAELATAARTRAGARRRRRFVGFGVAAVLAAGLGLTTVVDGGSAPVEVPAVAEDGLPTSEGEAPAGWHPVQWRGVSIHVPNTWGSGALGEWCRRGPLLGTPVVERPGAPGTARCSDPALGYGVQFLGPGRSERLKSHDVRSPRPTEATLYPKDAWVGVICARCEVAIRVVAPDLYVARYLLSSYGPASAEPSG